MQSLRIFIKIIAMFILFIYAQQNVDIANNANDQDADDLNLVTVHAEDAHLPSILAILAKEVGIILLLDPNVNRQEKFTIHLDDVPIEQAINLVVRAVVLVMKL